MNTLKSIGSTLLGIAIFVGIIVATILFFTLGAKVAFTIAPFINWLAGILFIINLALLLVALIPKARGIVGLIIYISSIIVCLRLVGVDLRSSGYAHIVGLAGGYHRRAARRSRCCANRHTSGNLLWRVGHFLDFTSYRCTHVWIKNGRLCAGK